MTKVENQVAQIIYTDDTNQTRQVGLLAINLQYFAEDSGGEKTEEPTEKKKRDTRKKGEVARSKEVPIAASLLLGVFLLYFLLPVGGEKLGLWIISLWATDPDILNTPVGALKIAQSGILASSLLVGTLWGSMLVINLLSNILQVGFLFSTETLKPKINRLNPISGAKRIFSIHALVELVKSLLKIALLSGISILLLRTIVQEIPSVAALPLYQGINYIGSKAFLLTVWITASFILVAALDWFFQRFQHNKKLKMSMSEVKEEHKQMEGDPLVRNKIRERQRAIAQNRMIKDMKTADVLITNPTHYAVALKYDIDTMIAPMVVAKGKDHFAIKLREVAKEHNIKIVEQRDLARALYSQTEVGDMIPETLYMAVAEILTSLEHIRRKLATRRT